MSEHDVPPLVSDEVLQALDRRFVFWTEGNPGEHFLLGNAHTWPGRIYAVHEDGYGVVVSKADIVRASELAEAWILGFLNGSEPAPPDDESEQAQEKWKKKVLAFHASGELE